MKTNTMNARGKLATAILSVLALGACASLDIDQAVDDANRAIPAFTNGQLEVARTGQQHDQRARVTRELLAAPLGMDDAVRLALVNSPTVQALIAQAWSEMAEANQAGRVGNPIFTFERIRSGDELEIGRLLTIGLLDLITLPARQSMAGNRVEQAKVQLAANVVEHVNRVRQAWINAVAAQQQLAYAEQVGRAARAGAELARRMEQVGNFSKLQRARQHAFYADAAAQLAAASHVATSAREELIRQLGLDGEQSVLLRLPERLPELPKEPRGPAELGRAALDQRLDIRLARLQLDVAGRAQGLNLLNTVFDVELGRRHDTRFDNAGGTRSVARGWEAEIRLPLFDWGGAQLAAMNARSLLAATRYDAAVRAAGSQLREGYSAYRTAYDIARHYRDEVVPLRKTISDENVLRYNGMLIGVFELLADARDQIATVMAAINAQQQFWLANAALASTLVGRPVTAGTARAATATPSGAEAGH
ncbi:MAG: TolC family protein [Burkholderiales bacterium]|nr:TolC family protein [Burkholderiales bacterium]